MTSTRVLAIGLDGFDYDLARRLMDAGGMPNLRRLHGRSVRYALEHGRDRNSGLAWEHFSSGRSPSEGGRWSSVRFDPATYLTCQEPTTVRPFLADIDARAVVFDTPYCDLKLAPRVRGLTTWGAHDPGVPPASRPEELRQELLDRFGPYPAAEWIYGFCWPSAAKTRAASDALTRAVRLRAEAARWLLAERLPDWDLAVVVVSESHSALEPLWHGADPSHPLFSIDSAREASEGIGRIYGAIDELVGMLGDLVPDATLLLFAMHGMGPNEADVPSMALLPELLFRHTFGRPHMRPVSWSMRLPNGVPLLRKSEAWGRAAAKAIPRVGAAHPRAALAARSTPAWMPATWYAPFWPQMRAFALPSYYDGRIRLNLEGREREGLVRRRDYDSECERLIQLLKGCRNLLTGEPCVAEVHRPKNDPDAVGEFEPDLYITWMTAPLGLSCPAVGDIGALPYRRTGGHTGGTGFLYLSGDGLLPHDGGTTSSFNVVPTILELLGERKPARVSGVSLVSRTAAVGSQQVTNSATDPRTVSA